MLINRFGNVWVGRRTPKWLGKKSNFIWQMPQGGIGQKEKPIEAALRELAEETGVKSVELLAKTDDWLTYELPPHLLGIALKGRYRGQRQRWFAMRFLGSDSEIDIRPRKRLKAEFDAWRWVPMDDVPSLIVPFKRPMYETLVAEFGRLAR
jgi:putative (di)nucleoside polyphosphate hydrolase